MLPALLAHPGLLVLPVHLPVPEVRAVPAARVRARVQALARELRQERVPTLERDCSDCSR